MRARPLAIFAFGLFTVSGSAFAQEVPREKVKEVLEKFSGEPTIQEVQAWTAKYSQVGPEVIRGMMGRARLAPFLPRISTYMDRILQHDETLDTEAGAADQFGINTHNDTRTRIRADWDMSEWLFNPDEVRLLGEVDNVAHLREDLLSAVTKVYFERRRLQVELVLEPSTDLAVAVKKELRLQELTATLDSYTGGAFSKQLRASRSSN